MRLRSLLVVAAVVVAVLAVTAAPAHARTAAPVQQPGTGADDAGTSGDETENPEPGAPDQDMIPLPNSGREPTDAGDRGGALQIGVFVAIVAGLGGIGALAVRDVRRGRARADRT